MLPTAGRDKELDAISVILEVLAPFSLGMRARILEYVDKRASEPQGDSHD